MTTSVVKLKIGRMKWWQLMLELRDRGNGVRESGAFILAPRDSIRAACCIYYDDLDPDCLDAGYIRLNGSAYVGLADICETSQLRVIADVHTHPGKWTGQSPSDRAHPMISRTSHIALIVPQYAHGNRLSMAGVGAFEHLGNGQWRDCRSEVRLSLLW